MPKSDFILLLVIFALLGIGGGLLYHSAKDNTRVPQRMQTIYESAQAGAKDILSGPSTFVYVKDPTTELCFAVMRGYGGFSGITNVPCSEPVRRRIEGFNVNK